MLAYGFEISDGNSTRKSATTIAHEYLATENMEKVENRSTYSPIVTNDGLQEKDTNETDDKDYSGDVGVESSVSPTVFMEREVTRNPLTANAQYFSDGKEADSSAYSDDRTTLKPSKNSEISDLFSKDVTHFEFSGYSQLETSDDSEQSDDLSKGVGSEMSGSGGSREESFYFSSDLEGFSTTVELDLGARTTEEEFLKVAVEEAKVSTSKYSSHSKPLNVENTSYIFAMPKDADNYKSNHSSSMPTELFGGIRRRTRPTVRRNKANEKVTAEFLSVTSAVNNRRLYTSDKYEASKVPSNMASTISMEIDLKGILIDQNESIVNASPDDNSLRNLYSEMVGETGQKNPNLSNVPEGRAATDFKKSSTSFSSEHSGLDEHMDEEKSRAVFISTSPPHMKTSTKDYVLQNGVELALNSTANEQSAKSHPSQKSIMIICSAIIIPLVIVAIIAVICIRRNLHKKNCCTKTVTNVEESRWEEDPSTQLNEVIERSRTDPPQMEHLGIAQEA